MKMNKKNIAAAVAGLILLGAATGGAYAYFTDSEKTVNNITIGSNEITITEEFPTPEPPAVGENTYVKKVAVTNTGDVDCFVRVYAEFEDNAVREVSEYSRDNGATYVSEDEFRATLPENWEYRTDGDFGPYYYYKLPIAPGESTPNLFTNLKVTFATENDVKPFKFVVYAESVQTKDRHGEDFTGENIYRQAWEEYLNNPAETEPEPIEP